MANTLRGRVLEVRPTQTAQTKSGNTFSKRELILDCTRFDPYTGERGYENTPCVTFMQNSCSLLDQIVPGMVVEVGIDIVGHRGSDTTSPVRYFNDVRGFKIEQIRVAIPQAASAPQPAHVAQPQPAPVTVAQHQAPPQPYGNQQQYGYPQPGVPFPGGNDPFTNPAADPFA